MGVLFSMSSSVERSESCPVIGDPFVLADAVTPIVTQTAVDGVPCFTTYELAISLSDDVHNVHSMYGNITNPMIIPAAFQASAGADVGGLNPQFVAAIPDLAYDSWLTLGSTDGSTSLTSTGIDFSVRVQPCIPWAW